MRVMRRPQFDPNLGPSLPKPASVAKPSVWRKFEVGALGSRSLWKLAHVLPYIPPVMML